MLKIFGIEIEGVEQILALTAGLHFLLMVLGCIALVILIRARTENVAELAVKAALVVAFIGGNLYLSTAIARAPVTVSFDTKPTDARRRIMIVHHDPGEGLQELRLDEIKKADIAPDALLMIDVDKMFDDAEEALTLAGQMAILRDEADQLNDEIDQIRAQVRGLRAERDGFRSALIRMEGGGIAALPGLLGSGEAGD